MSKFYYVLDNGHGGMIDGVYQTEGKRSPVYDNQQIFEGVYNRKVVDIISSSLTALNIDNHILVPEQEDISLQERVERANNIYKEHPNAILLSFHLNGGGGTGFEAYTSKGYTFSDKIASYFYRYISEHSDFTIRTDYSDGDPDKESQFYILRNTYCPAVLLESLFMDNKDDFYFLNAPGAPNYIANLYINTILNIEKYL